MNARPLLGLSPYIDLLRLVLACWVVLGHMHSRRVVDFPFGEFAYRTGHEAVILFFVLSGLVVSESARRRHAGLREYAIARFARIYSVALPALVITLLLDLTALSHGSASAERYPLWQYDNFWAHFLVHAAFLGQLWEWTLTPFSNVPYWSLSYEVWYYVLFGAVHYLDGRRRAIAVLLILAAMGPKLWLLAPCWWIGVWLGTNAGRFPLRAWQGVLVAAGALGALVLLHGGIGGLPPLRSALGPATLYSAKMTGMSRWFLADWITAALFAALLVGFAATNPRMHAALAWRVRHWAGASFSLYLVHDPVLKLLATTNSLSGHWLVSTLLVLGAVGWVTASFASFTERRLILWTRAVRWAASQAAARLPARRHHPVQDSP